MVSGPGPSEPVKKSQSSALLLDFWLGQGVRAAAIPAAVLPMLCIALRAAFGRLSPFARLSRPSSAGQAKRHATLWARARQAVWPRCPLGYSPLRGCAARAHLPAALLTSRAALSNFSQVLRQISNGPHCLLAIEPPDRRNREVDERATFSRFLSGRLHHLKR